MRKYVLSLVALAAFVGFSIAASVTIVKWDGAKSELTVKDGDKEHTYKVTDKTVVKAGDKTLDLEKAKKGWDKAGEKLAGRKLDITTEKDTITEIKMAEMKKKDK
ncbi:hypothetical protein BH11PLA2_BH11PLA2_04150 [soil metagenome]